jgi:hypothetical protein
MRLRFRFLPAVVLVACGGGASTPKTTPIVASASVAPTVAPSASTSSPRPRFTKCGALDCRLYDDLGNAVEDALADGPLVVGFGEAHAQKGKEAYASSAKHFTKEILPRLASRTSNVVLELMAPPTGCDKTKKKVEKELSEVGKKQQETDANEYVTLGKTAQSLGVTVTQLSPSCADFAQITKPKADVLDLLRMIKKLTVKEVTAISGQPARDPAKMILFYGGAFHTEPDPPVERADFSIAADMDKLTAGRYASVHLFVREFVDDKWSDWPWYATFTSLDAKAHAGEVTMFHPKPKHWVILTAATK